MNIGRVVIISEVEIPGIIVRITRHEDMTVYSIRSITGVLYSREAHEMTDADAETAAQTIADVKILSERHEELADAFAAVARGTDEVVPGVTHASISFRPVTMPSGVVLTRFDVVAEMRRTFAAKHSMRRTGPVGYGRIRTVTEMI
jgi:hypothetical protein